MKVKKDRKPSKAGRKKTKLSQLFTSVPSEKKLRGLNVIFVLMNYQIMEPGYENTLKNVRNVLRT